jgi:2-amino-4-hydroxy-6-hydroxymethyldihydropteridine diphosphokinase
LRKKSTMRFSKFEEWEPYYLQILADFGFDRAADEEAARVLDRLLPHDSLPLLEAAIRGKAVTVCGNAPSLDRDLDRLTGVVVAADRAADRLFRQGIRPAVITTDLDGATEEFVEMNRRGTVIVVHAHGDNIPLLRRWVPHFPGPLVGTTQARPVGCIHNFGGFSDGDRAVYLAHGMGASPVTLAGFDLDDPAVGTVKRKKLLWARRLLALIGHDL